MNMFVSSSLILRFSIISMWMPFRKVCRAKEREPVSSESFNSLIKHETEQIKRVIIALSAVEFTEWADIRNEKSILNINIIISVNELCRENWTLHYLVIWSGRLWMWDQFMPQVKARHDLSSYDKKHRYVWKKCVSKSAIYTMVFGSWVKLWRASYTTTCFELHYQHPIM